MTDLTFEQIREINTELRLKYDPVFKEGYEAGPRFNFSTDANPYEFDKDLFDEMALLAIKEKLTEDEEVRLKTLKNINEVCNFHRWQAGFFAYKLKNNNETD